MENDEVMIEDDAIAELERFISVTKTQITRK